MKNYRVVIDTNVFVAFLRSRRGASYRLITLMESGGFEVSISIPLILEYEDVAKRLMDEIPISEKAIHAILNYVCKYGIEQKIYYLWRPIVKDPKDDMVFELAVAAGCDFVVTFNTRDFRGIEQFGIRVITPKEFLQEIGEIS